ncbi:MAG: N-6 DNA methylase [candidate division Zixibacteria bacterium]|nr:N-6 DNA methylase [candidate division Zixibacteria bacterium]
MNTKQEDLFTEHDPIRYGDIRRHSNLFLPKYLVKESKNTILMDEAQDKAYEIILKWTELESKGKLEKKKETTLEGEFITEVFGDALGYSLFSENKKQWNIESKYSVNGGEADAAIGFFEPEKKTPPFALIELKGPNTNLDRDRFNGRTAVQQCWDYLDAIPECPWGIVSNFVSFRLYHRNHTPRAYQLFVLRELQDKEKFRQFYYLLQRAGLLPIPKDRKPRAVALLEDTSKQQQKVGDELYNHYSYNRKRMINHLKGKPHNKTLDKSISIAQKLLDRIIFVAFCEDRKLLPENSLHKAYSKLPPFSRVTNPKWQNFLDLFHSIDKGNKNRGIPPYNGGLFKEDPEIDNLNLNDDWTTFFDSIGKYDFRDEVNVDVLGHLFEKSVNEIERIKLGGLFGEEFEDNGQPAMDKSVERKQYGIYYTPPEFTKFITHNTINRLIDERFEKILKEHKLTANDLNSNEKDSRIADYWKECLHALRQIKIVDPACGSGAFLISAYDCLESRYSDVINNIIFHDNDDDEELLEKIPDFILHDNIFGVDLSYEAVEITQLALWLRTAQEGRTLADLSKNIICGNSIVDDPEVHPRAMIWDETFPEIFNRENSGFDCVIGNPPWERIKLQEREFFDVVSADIAASVNASARRKLIAKLKNSNPELHQRYTEAKSLAENTLHHIRKADRFKLAANGDINTYAVFAELAYRIAAPDARVGILVPTGIATDYTNREFFNTLVDSKSLVSLYDFENKAPTFPDVHRSYKFCVLLFGGHKKKFKKTDFVFFAHSMDELKNRKIHIELNADDFKLFNPNTRTCPIFRTPRDAKLTKYVYQRVPILIDKNREKGGNPWGIKFYTMFHQTNDAELFHTADKLKTMKYKRHGAVWEKGKKVYLPLYEAKMIQMYDHRAASIFIKDTNWMRQGQTKATVLSQHQNPEFNSEPRWWVNKESVIKEIGSDYSEFISYKDITSPTNLRTMIAAFIPFTGVLNSAPLILTSGNISNKLQCCLLANLNSIPMDFIARQKVGGVHLNFFIIEQLPIFSPDFYADRCPWNRRSSLEKWISDRVLKLTCTSNDMIPLAKAAGFDPPVHKWKPDERTDLMAQLDAAYLILYGINREDVEYILSTFSGIKKEGEGMFESQSSFNLILKHYDSLIDTSNL